MSRLYMVGTHHLDTKGPERLNKFLDFVRPDIIGIESTQDQLNARVEDHKSLVAQSTMLRSMLSLQYGHKGKQVYDYLHMLGYEQWVPSEYARKMGLELAFCEKPMQQEFNQVAQEVFGEAVDSNNQVTGNFMDEVAKVDIAEYQATVDRAYMDSFVAESGTNSDFYNKFLLSRDEVLEMNIRTALNRSESTMVYIGGTLHMFGDYPNLFERLVDVQPMRVRLLEVDKF